MTAPDARAEALVAHYERAGYARVAPAILQPAEPFLDLSGEDIRRRMFLTTDPDGRELCLRPDLTIPVSRDYLASPRGGRGARLLLSRRRCSAIAARRRPNSSRPASSSFGRRDTAAADAEMLALGLEATTHYGVDAPEIRMGDVGLFAALVAALDLCAAWKRRLVKDFNRAGSLADDLDRLVNAAAIERPEYQGVLAALAGSDPKAAHALVTDLLSIAGITAVGGRTVGEIADRFLEQAALGASSGLPRATRALIEQFLAISGDPDEAADALRTLAAEHELDLPPRSTCSRAAPASSPRRASRSRASSSPPRSAAASTTTPASCSSCTTRRCASSRQLVAGGRYDGLLSRLGAAAPIPAVGFAVWIERLERDRDGAHERAVRSRGAVEGPAAGERRRRSSRARA